VSNCCGGGTGGGGGASVAELLLNSCPMARIFLVLFDQRLQTWFSFRRRPWYASSHFFNFFNFVIYQWIDLLRHRLLPIPALRELERLTTPLEKSLFNPPKRPRERVIFVRRYPYFEGKNYTLELMTLTTDSYRLR